MDEVSPRKGGTRAGKFSLLAFFAVQGSEHLRGLDAVTLKQTTLLQRVDDVDKHGGATGLDIEPLPHAQNFISVPVHDGNQEGGVSAPRSGAANTNLATEGKPLIVDDDGAIHAQGCDGIFNLEFPAPWGGDAVFP